MNSVVCPNCGTLTYPTIAVADQNAADVKPRTYGAVTYSRVYAKLIENLDYDACYGIALCQLCQHHLVIEKPAGGDGNNWRVVYPIAQKSVPTDVPPTVRANFSEAYLCLAVQANRACVAMCQATLESTWRDRNVSGLNELKEAGVISPRMFAEADEVRLWSNIVKHESVEDVDLDDVRQLVGYVESLLDHVYVQPTKLEALKTKRGKPSTRSKAQ